MPTPEDSDETDWEHSGLDRREAALRWRNYFAGRQGLPVDVSVYDPDAFTARLIQRGVGQLRIMHIHGPAQMITYSGPFPEAGSAGHTLHLVYALQGTLDIDFSGRLTSVEAHHAALIDNTSFYTIDMKTEHEVIVAIIPMQWLVRYIPEPLANLCKLFDMREGWAPPLASLLQTITHQPGDYPAPRPVIAEQIGTLLAFAMRSRLPMAENSRGRLVHRIMQRIENGYSDPDLTPEHISREFGFSKRYLQSLLANSGTSFVRELTAIRLDRANEMLTDPLSRSLSIGDIAFRCGFLDPAYFARQFRKRFDTTPRAWREMG